MLELFPRDKSENLTVCTSSLQVWPFVQPCEFERDLLTSGYGALSGTLSSSSTSLRYYLSHTYTHVRTIYLTCATNCSQCLCHNHSLLWLCNCMLISCGPMTINLCLRKLPSNIPVHWIILRRVN